MSEYRGRIPDQMTMTLREQYYHNRARTNCVNPNCMELAIAGQQYCTECEMARGRVMDELQAERNSRSASISEGG
jgi:hypothetical protein